MKLPIDIRSVFARIGDLLIENLGLKLLSFAFALGLYGFIHGAQDSQRTLPVDVTATPPPASAHRVLITPLPPLVRVTMRGPKTILDELKAEDIDRFQVDLRSGKVDRIEFDPSTLHLPPGVHAEQVDPPSISLRWEDEVLREIPVQTSITGQPAAGFIVKGAPKVEPSTVRAIGPRSVVEVVQFARADAFDVTGIDKEGSYEHTLALDRPPARVELEAQTVTVRVEIGREESHRVFVRIPVQLLGVSRGALTPPEVDVNIDGPPEIVRSLRPEQVVPTVDLRSAGVNTGAPGSTKLPVMVEVDGCRAAVQPQNVVVRW
ncbi:MAG TPA: CdaR family protein [Polyangiaceae bacterium]|nr:CdaR family protein [Polyangiaceae bacterium]